MSDRERDSIQEMEDIQKGLEAFLQQEMQDMQVSGTRRSAGRPTANDGTRGAERQTEKHPAPQMYDMREDDEDEEEPDVIGSDRRSRSRERQLPRKPTPSSPRRSSLENGETAQTARSASRPLATTTTPSSRP